MAFQRELRQGLNQAHSWTCAFRMALSVFLVVGFVAHSSAQVPKSSPTQPTTVAAGCPFDKDEGFVKGVVILGGAQAPLFCSSAREVLWKRS